MPVPTSSQDYISLTERSGVLAKDVLATHVDALRAAGPLPEDPLEVAKLLVDRGALTYFQADQLLQGKWKGFMVGKYQILEKIGSGGMGVVYLAEHKILQRRVAIKVLPLALAQDPWFLELFYKEAQAIAALDHPNVVHAHDIDSDGSLHFLVMEYVDGLSFQHIVSKQGAMSPLRTAHYIRQAALGLQHAHEARLVHRDIKPSNLLLDRQGVVKILDLGLAQFFVAKPVGTSKAKARIIVGTDDYLAPEQIVDSENVDIRADIYSLGAAAYYMLTGQPPFGEGGEDHEKFIKHLTRRPEPIRAVKPEVQAGLAAVFERMMAKNPWERYQTPAEIARALETFAKEPIPPPPAHEMPDLSPAARRGRAPDSSPSSAIRRGSGPSSWVICTDATLPGSTAVSDTPANPAAKKSGS